MKYYIEFKDRWYDLEDLPNEEWLQISGYEGLYEVSNYGRVKSLNYLGHNKIQILKYGKDKKGYLFVILQQKGKKRTFKIHRLVATAFLENPENLPQVNHRDEDKHNNYIGNLEWCNNYYNAHYGTAIDRRVEKQINGKLSKSVLQYDLYGNFIAEFPSASEVKRQLGFSQVCISRCCRGERKSSHGYIWKYK